MLLFKQTRQAFLLLKIQVLSHCFSSTTFLSMVTLRKPLKIRTYLEPNQPELSKTTLKYKNLYSLTSKIIGSYMRVFTVCTCRTSLEFP